MDGNERQWTAMDVNEQMAMDGNGRQCTSMYVDGHQWTPMDVDGVSRSGENQRVQ
jgi:hypothetical protein